MWIHRKSENPSTEVECYWRRSTLGSIRSTKQCIGSHELSNTSKAESSLVNNSQFRHKLLKKAHQLQLSSQLSPYNFNLEIQKSSCLSIHKMMFQFIKTGFVSADKFLEYARQIMTDDLCRMAEFNTRTQSDSSIWHELQYGRITKIYETAHFKTIDGSLVQQIIGGSKVFESRAI